MDSEVKEVDVTKITLNPYQPRRCFSQAELEELALSIKTIGLIHPPVVRPIDKGPFSYELVSGERRFRAVQLAGLSSIAVIIRSGSATLSAQAALIENIQRVDLNPMEIAQGFQRLIDEFSFSQEHIAERIGKKRSTIANYLRLLGLPDSIQQSVETGQISMGHAKGLLALNEPKQQEILHEKILRDQLSVRKTEELAAKWQEQKEPTEKKRAIHLERLSEKMQERLGTRVSIQGNENKGRLSIDYYSLDDLNRIIELLGFEE